jgi:hypothetical protein
MPRPICVFVIREHKLRRVPHSKPANIASTVDAANSCAKAPVKTGGRPAFRRIRINDRRNSAAVKGEFYFWLLIVKRSITAPGPLELHLVDSSAEFCNEPLHRDHLIYHSKQRALRELTTPMRETNAFQCAAMPLRANDTSGPVLASSLGIPPSGKYRAAHPKPRNAVLTPPCVG